MFAYFIIGIELIILYFVFWVVFIREPKPREIRAELWGRYQGVQENSSGDRRKDRSISVNRNKVLSLLSSRLKIPLYRMARLRRLRNRHYRHLKQYCANKRPTVPARANNRRQAPIEIDMQQDINRQLAEKFLLVLNRTLNKLSVKIPY